MLSKATNPRPRRVCRACVAIWCIGGALGGVGRGYADVQPIVDLLTANGFGTNDDNNSGHSATDFPPGGVVTLDFYVDLTPADLWNAAGIAARLTNPLANIVYWFDPNDQPVLTAPEAAGSPSRHVSFVSLPSSRESAFRFSERGAANLAGGYDPPTAVPQADAMNFNVASFYSGVPDSPRGDGFVGRVTIDVSDLLAAQGLGPDDLFLGAPGERFPAVANIAFAANTSLNPTLQRIDLTLYAIPEPPTLVLVVVGSLMVAPNRRR